MAGHGGRREGAGRPKGTLAPSTMDKLEARAYLRQRVVASLQDMLDAQIDHAQGIKYLVARAKNGGKFEKVSPEQLDEMLAGQDDGSIVLEVWHKDPSVQAFTDLLNRALDKPADHVEVTGADGGPLVVQWKD